MASLCVACVQGVCIVLINLATVLVGTACVHTHTQAKSPMRPQTTLRSIQFSFPDPVRKPNGEMSHRSARVQFTVENLPRFGPTSGYTADAGGAKAGHFSWPQDRMFQVELEVEGEAIWSDLKSVYGRFGVSLVQSLGFHPVWRLARAMCCSLQHTAAACSACIGCCLYCRCVGAALVLASEPVSAWSPLLPVSTVSQVHGPTLRHQWRVDWSNQRRHATGVQVVALVGASEGHRCFSHGKFVNACVSFHTRHVAA